MTNNDDGSREHTAHSSPNVRANTADTFANLTHLPHLPHLTEKNSLGYEHHPTSRNAPRESATVDGLEDHPTPVDPAAASGPVEVVAECEALRAEVERLRVQVASTQSQLDAARRWQAKRVVAISQDPTCIKWMRESEQMLAEVEAAEARLEAVQARADTAEARISAAFGVIGETGCFCVDDPPEEDCPNHRIEAALLGTWTEAEVADVKRRARELAERLRPHFEDAPLPDAALASPPEPEADERFVHGQSRDGTKWRVRREPIFAVVDQPVPPTEPGEQATCKHGEEQR